MGEPLIAKGFLGEERVKVFCIQCKRDFMALTDIVDPYDPLPQYYPRCDRCLERTKIRVIGLG